jgi:hypothetical protein
MNWPTSAIPTAVVTARTVSQVEVDVTNVNTAKRVAFSLRVAVGENERLVSGPTMTGQNQRFMNAPKK